MTCPFLRLKYEEDWGLSDPSGKDDKEYMVKFSYHERGGESSF
nr:hypothetical protein [Natranaerobius trueperi]